VALKKKKEGWLQLNVQIKEMESWRSYGTAESKKKTRNAKRKQGI
jgi:hypothetical protein